MCHCEPVFTLSWESEGFSLGEKAFGNADYHIASLLTMTVSTINTNFVYGGVKGFLALF